MRFIDISEENVKKTILFYDTNLKVKDYTPKYNKIECFEQYEDGSGINFHLKTLRWDKFKKAYAERRILSVHDYDDTRSTSICLERLYS